MTAVETGPRSAETRSEPAQVPSEKASSHERNRGRRPWGIVLAVGALAVAVGGSIIGYNSRNSEVDALRTEKELAIELGQAGYNNVVSLETQSDGDVEATLRLDPDDLTSCTLAFNVERTGGPEQENIQMVLPRTDAAGSKYDEIVSRKPEETGTLMTKECQ